MNWKALSVFSAGVLSFLFCSCPANKAKSVKANEVKADYVLPTVCPYGDTTLKRVKVIQGGPAPLDAKMEKAVANHDILFTNTCMRDPSMPPETVYCRTCGFLKQPGCGDVWTRTAEDPATFPQPFSTLVRSYPVPAKFQCTRIEYTQDVRDSLVFSERLGFITTDPLASLKEKSNEWAKPHRLPLNPTTLPDASPHPLYPNGKALTEQYQYWGTHKRESPMNGHVGFIAYPEDGIVMVDLLITINPSLHKSIDAVLETEPIKAFEPAAVGK
jgi:hypothetical protein